MKRKIITTSTACLTNNPDIEVIPDIIKFSENEIYNDFIDYAPLMVYNRMTYDKYASPRVYPQKAFYIKEVLRRLMLDGYDSFIFIIPSIDILDYRTNASIATSKLECDVAIYESKQVGYPEAYLALEANRLIKTGLTNVEICEELKKIDMRMSLFIFTYKNDLNLEIGVNIDEIDLNSLPKQGRIYRLDGGRLVALKHDSKKTPLLSLLESFLAEIDGTKSVPFIISTSSSQYRMVIENKLIKMYNGLSEIKSYTIPSALGVRLGGNILSIGYIKKE